MNRLTARLCALSIALAMLSPPAASALEKVVIDYSPTDALLAAYIAKEQGFFEQHGIDATVQIMPGTSTAMPAALVANSVQLASGTFPILLLAHENGVDVKVLADAIDSAPGYHISAVTVRLDSSIKTAKDLEGKTVGVPGLNNSIHVLFVKWLADHSADPGKVHFVEAALPQMGDLLKSGQMDAVTVVEPITTRITQSGAGRVLSYFTDDLPAGVPSYIWMVSGEYAKAHPDVMKGLRAALDEGLAFYRAHPEAAEATLATFTRMPLEIIRNTQKPPYVNEMNAAKAAFWIKVMQQEKLLMKPVDPASLLVP